MADALVIVLVVAIPLVIILLAWLASALVKYIVSNTSIKINDSTVELIYKYLDIIKTNARTIVISLNQTLVDELKSKSEDGKLSDEEISAIRQTAVNQLREMLSDDVVDLVEPVCGDIDTYLIDLVETTVKEVKNNNK